MKRVVLYAACTCLGIVLGVMIVLTGVIKLPQSAAVPAVAQSTTASESTASQATMLYDVRGVEMVNGQANVHLVIYGLYSSHDAALTALKDIGEQHRVLEAGPFYIDGRYKCTPNDDNEDNVVPGARRGEQIWPIQ